MDQTHITPETVAASMGGSAAQVLPAVVLPSREVQQFLIESVNQLNYPGKMVEFVVEVKRALAAAHIGCPE